VIRLIVFSKYYDVLGIVQAFETFAFDHLLNLAFHFLVGRFKFVYLALITGVVTEIRISYFIVYTRFDAHKVIHVLGIVARLSVEVILHGEGNFEVILGKVKRVICSKKILLNDFSLKRVFAFDVDVETDQSVGKQNDQAAQGNRGAIVRVDGGVSAHVHLEVVAEHVKFFEA
jgi:hypothetical protein